MTRPIDFLRRPPAPGSGVVGDVVVERPGLRVTRYAGDDADRAAVVLVPPLAVPAAVYDLRPGHSLLQHLLDRGHPVHLVDYGEVGFAQRGLGMEHWVDGLLPRALACAADVDGPVHVLGWSLGGTLGLLTVAADPSLPVRSLTMLGTPIDYRAMPAYRPLTAAASLTGGRVVATAARTLGGAPAPLVRAGYRTLGLPRELRRPLTLLRHRDDPDRLAQERAIDGFLRSMPGYPGRFFVQLWHRVILGGQLAVGRVEVGGREVDLRALALPVLAIGSRDDEIAHWAAVRAIEDVLTPEWLRLVEVGGGHLNLLTGTLAPTSTWPAVDTFLQDVDAISPSLSRPAT